MPKVRTYRCSLCAYKSKDKDKVEKHTRLHNVFRRESDSDEKSDSPAENEDLSQSSDVGGSEVELEKSATCSSDTDTGKISPVKPGKPQIDSMLQSNSASAQSKPPAPVQLKKHGHSVKSTVNIEPKILSPSKKTTSVSPSKLSKSHLSRTRPLDTTLFPLVKSPSPTKKSVSGKLNNTPSSRDKKYTPKGRINAVSNVAKSPINSKCKVSSKCRVLALAQLEVESLEEIRFRYYVDRLKTAEEMTEVKEEPAEVKEEVMDCEHEVLPTSAVLDASACLDESALQESQSESTPKTPTVSASLAVSTSTAVSASSSSAVIASSAVTASKSASSVVHADSYETTDNSKSMHRVLHRKHSKAEKSKTISKKSKKKRRARILSEDVVAEIVPEFVSEEQAFADFESGDLSKRRKTNENDNPQSNKKECIKKVDTENFSCRINQDTVMSIKRGLLGSTVANQLPGPPSTNNLTLVTSPTTTNSVVEVCSARLVPLSQPPLVAPLTIPVTDLLTVTTSNINVLNIPLRVGGVLSQPPPVLVPVSMSVWPTNQNQPSSIPAILPPAAWLPGPVFNPAPFSNVSQMESVTCPRQLASRPDINPAISETIQSGKEKSSDSVVNVLLELDESNSEQSKSLHPKKSSDKSLSPKEVAQELLEEITSTFPSGISQLVEKNTETPNPNGLIVPPNKSSLSPNQTLVAQGCRDSCPVFVEPDPSLNRVNESNNLKTSYSKGKIKSSSKVQKQVTKSNDKPLHHSVTTDPDRPTPFLKEKPQNEPPPQDRSGNLPSDIYPDYSEEVSEIKTMLDEVRRMLTSTGVLVGNISKRVAKLESRMGNE
ncbi:hypothetical protein ACHWQZ_G003959 [Mnemiopsis leidyi]